MSCLRFVFVIFFGIEQDITPIQMIKVKYYESLSIRVQRNPIENFNVSL